MSDDTEYDQKFWNEAYKSDPEQTIVRDFFLEEEIAHLPVGSALDLGCGTGVNGLMLAKRGWSVTGVDWAREAIKLANSAARASGLDAHFYVGDTTSWDPPNLFDLVYSTFSLPEGTGMGKVVNTMAEALKPGGTLIICEWDKRMSKVWGFDEDALPTPGSLVALIPDLEIEIAATRKVENAFGDDAARGKKTNEAFIAFVRACKVKN